MMRQEIAQSFSTGNFEPVFPYLSDTITWKIYGNTPAQFEGKEQVILQCKQIRDYFDSITADFQIEHVITDGVNVAINGTANLLREGKSINFIQSCDIYEFDKDDKIHKITSYCIENKTHN